MPMKIGGKGRVKMEEAATPTTAVNEVALVGRVLRKGVISLPLGKMPQAIIKEMSAQAPFATTALMMMVTNIVMEPNSIITAAG
jgi:hypothetical protein